MTKFIPKKLIVDLDERGQVVRTFLQYKLSVDGSIDKDVKSIAVNAQIKVAEIEAMLKDSVDRAGEAEGLGAKVSEEVFTTREESKTEKNNEKN